MILPLSHEETSTGEGNLNGYESQLLLFYIYTLNGYGEIDSYEEPCIYANGNTITSFARELKSIGVGEHIYIYIYIYIYILSSTCHISIYIYIYLYCFCWSIIVEGDPKASFPITTTPRFKGRC